MPFHERGIAMYNYIFIVKFSTMLCLLFLISGCNTSNQDFEIQHTYSNISESEIITDNVSIPEESKNDIIDYHETSSVIAGNNEEYKTINPDGIYLDNMNIDKLFKDFLYGDVSVQNSFNEKDVLNAFGWEETYNEWLYDKDKDYKCIRKFALVDLDNDSKDELIFSAGESENLEEVILLLHSDGNQLYCWDIYETHTQHMVTAIYTNGVVKWGQNHTGAEEVYYRYDTTGTPYELIHFSRFGESKGDFIYNGFYLNGNKNRISLLNSYEEYENLLKQYIGELKSVRWFNCDDIEK